MADGKFKIEIKGMLAMFCDCSMVAVHTARTLLHTGEDVSVWEKDHSGWQKIYPV